MMAAQPRTIEQIAAELTQARGRLDRGYQMSDDFSAYCRGRDAAARVAQIEAELKEAERHGNQG